MIRLLFASLAMVLAACASQPTDSDSPLAASLRTDELGLSSGTSFGMCAGYCRTELALDSPSVVFTEISQRETLPVRVRSITLSATEWERIHSALDLVALTRLEGVHGCPDCADGGAEWIEIEQPATLRVTFEHGAVLGPIAPLQTELRALRERFQR